MTSRRAIKAAREVLSVRPYSIPVDVIGLADREGINVVDQKLGPDVSGLLLRDGGTTTIAINDSHATVRQRFTIAHELGHYRLHRGVFINSTMAVNMRAEKHAGSWIEEAEANAFAAEVLMPEDAFLAEVQDYFRVHPRSHPDLLAYHLSEKFDVSGQAAAIRLNVLGVVPSV